MKIFYILIITLTLLCTHTSHAITKDILVVSIPPQAYFLKHIVGTTQDVVTFLPHNADPHTFEPSVQILQKLSKAKVFFTIGVGLENQWEQRLHAIAPSVLFIPSYIEKPTAYTIHTHEDNHHDDDTDEHSHHNPFFREYKDGFFIPVNQHVWTSPTAITVVIHQMLATLIELYPNYAQLYTNNANSLIEKVEALDAEIRNTLSTKKYRAFLSYHPSWSYFANEYQLEELVIEENEREPSAKTIVHLIKTAKEKHVRVILTQPQFSQKATQIISQELGSLPIISINPLQEDWFTMMKTLNDILSRYLQ